MMHTFRCLVAAWLIIASCLPLQAQSFLPGQYPAGASVGGAPPASFVFNGTDEVLARTLSTSGASTTIFTYSLWVKVVAYTGAINELWQVINSPTDSEFILGDISGSGDNLRLIQDAGSDDFSDVATGLSPDITTGNWEHLVLRYDSTQGTSDNRIRLYRNGTLLADTTGGAGEPALNEAHRLFANGFEHQIGAFLDISTFGNQKLAFIDVLDGVSQDASAFGFDDGGTWTRMPYTGSYGTHGFSLDGTDGFNDVSGNGQHFTGTNMTVDDNLDFADLPPF
jgi:hypothetical protein